MTSTQTLTRHRDIQNWVSSRKGMPAMVRAQNRFGEWRARLALRFHGADRPSGMPGVDQGMSPIGWTAWLAELDRQQLALKVSEGRTPEYELIERKHLN